MAVPSTDILTSAPAVPPVPTLVLVHGAWHGSWCWSALQTELGRLGVPSIAVDLPGHGDPAAAPDATTLADLTLDSYVDVVADAVEGADGPVVLVGHSLGGVTISQTAERLPGRIDGLVYVCALLMADGRSAVDHHADEPMSELLGAIEITDGALATRIRADAAPELFYGDCDAEDAAAATARLVAEPIAPPSTPLAVTAERWGAVPRAYVRCARDRAVSPEAQDRMVADVGVDVVVELDTSHSPFLSQPGRTAAVLADLAARLAGWGGAAPIP